MIHLHSSQHRVADRVHRLPAMHSRDTLASLSDPPYGELTCATLPGPPSKTRQIASSHDPQMTIARFVETKFIPEYVVFKRSSGQAFYQSILKHVITPEDIGRMFREDNHNQRKKLKSIPEWPYLGDSKLCEVGPDDINRLMSAALAKGYSTQTVKHVRNVIGAIFSHAKLEGYFLGQNPVSLVKPPKHRREDVVELTPEQAIEALGVMQYPEREMTLIGVFTGMSPAEIIGLQWGHVNLGDEELNENGMRIPPKTFCVRKRWYRGKSEMVPKKCQRDLPVTAPLLRILGQLKSRSLFTAPGDSILVSGTGTPINQTNVLNRRLRPIAKQLGLPSLSWQAFRRTHEGLASVLDREFGFSAGTISGRIVTAEFEDGARTAGAVEFYSA